MPLKRTGILNSTVFTTRETSETAAQVFVAFDLENYAPSDVLIDGISWGSIVPNSTDRTNFISQYVAIFRNLSVDGVLGYSPTAPIADPEKLIWMAERQSLSDQSPVEFSEPLRVRSGDKVTVLMPSPLFGAGLTATIYLWLSVRGRAIGQEGFSPRLRTIG